MAVLRKLPPAPPEADPRWGLPPPKRKTNARPRRRPWLARVRYTRASYPLAVRVPEATRRMLEWCTLAAGMPTISDYVRYVLDQHLHDVGFELEPGRTAQLPPPPIDGAGWPGADPDG